VLPNRPETAPVKADAGADEFARAIAGFVTTRRNLTQMVDDMLAPDCG
jgi:hypothetical protein